MYIHGTGQKFRSDIKNQSTPALVSRLYHYLTSLIGSNFSLCFFLFFRFESYTTRIEGFALIVVGTFGPTPSISAKSNILAVDDNVKPIQDIYTLFNEIL